MCKWFNQLIWNKSLKFNEVSVYRNNWVVNESNYFPHQNPQNVCWIILCLFKWYSRQKTLLMLMWLRILLTFLWFRRSEIYKVKYKSQTNKLGFQLKMVKSSQSLKKKKKKSCKLFPCFTWQFWKRTHLREELLFFETVVLSSSPV